MKPYIGLFVRYFPSPDDVFTALPGNEYVPAMITSVGMHNIVSLQVFGTTDHVRVVAAGNDALEGISPTESGEPGCWSYMDDGEGVL